MQGEIAEGLEELVPAPRCPTRRSRRRRNGFDGWRALHGVDRFELPMSPTIEFDGFVKRIIFRAIRSFYCPQVCKIA